jgi:hypothetical protein
MLACCSRCLCCHSLRPQWPLVMEPGTCVGALRLRRTEGYVKHLAIGGVVFLLLCAGATRVEAQEIASSFDQLAVLVKPGDKITVVDVTGRETKGRIGKLSRDALILATSAGPRQLGEVDVATISQRRGDSLTNGAIIGAVAGTAYFVTAAALLRDSDGGEVIIPTAIVGGVIFAGVGAAAGAGIDALISRRQVIYQKPAGRSRVNVSPVFGHGRRGAAVTVTF